MNTPFNLESELLPTIGGRRIGSSKRITLLEQIDRLGSISQAAKAVPMSYKAAWDAVDELNNLSPQPLVARQTGGKGGGGAALTDAGRALLDYCRRSAAIHAEIMARLHAHGHIEQPDLSLWQRLDMHFSADNQLAGTVAGITAGAVNNEVRITLGNGAELTAIVTQSSCERMGLHTGSPVFALIQAGAIVVAKGLGGAQVSARNRLPARIARVHTGSVSTEIGCDIGGGLTLNAMLTRTSAEAMRLAENDEVTLLIKAPAIILGCFTE